MSQKKKYKIIVSLICTILFFSFGFFLLLKGLNNYSSEQVGFTEKNNIDYKVYLKENNFFESPYLTRNDNMAYITSLIDNLDIDFNYNMLLGEKRSGYYTYSIKAVISAATQDKNSNYWTKEYVLLEPIKKEFDNSSVINIGENVKLNYQQYNDLLMDFKKVYSISIEGSLKVYLNIETNIKNNINDEYMKSKVTSSLSIPLTKATIEVPIEINAPASSGLLNSGIVYHEGISYLIYKVSGIALLLAGVISLIYFVLIFVKKGEQVYNYNKKLKQILKTYDEIIVTVTKQPNLENMNVVNVSSFNELLDAHGEIRMPINYYDSKLGAIFTLINDKMAYYYILEKK